MPPISVETENAEKADTSHKVPVQQIPYEPSGSAIGRRQFRFIALLTIINTIVLFLFLAGPVLYRTTNGWLQDYKRWEADRQNKRLAAQQQAAQQAHQLADFNAGLQFTSPENRVIYEEDPNRAANLLASGSSYDTVPFRNSSLRLPNLWQRPVRRISSDAAQLLQSLSKSDEFDRSPIIFLHSRKTPAGMECLVVVTLNVSLMVDEIVSLRFDPHPTQKQFKVHNWRGFSSFAIADDAAGKFGSSNFRRLSFSQSADKGTQLTWIIGEDDKWENGRIESDLHEAYRIFAGQPDPKDVSHFMIGYEINGKSGMIDGWLLNDQTVNLQPRTGTTRPVDNAGQSFAWNPNDTSAATRPVVPPALPPAPLRKD